MQSLLRELQSKIRYTIILPFLLLTLLVAVAGSAVALSLAASSQQERFNNQVIEVARNTNDRLRAQEIANLDYLQRIVFAPRNPQTGAPAVESALENENARGLEQALTPYFTAGMRDAGVRLDRLIAFDTTGEALVDLESYPQDVTGALSYTENTPLDLSSARLVQLVLAAQDDDVGDKFAGLMQLPTSALDGGVPDDDDEIDSAFYFATVAPVYKDLDPQNDVIGGLLLAMRVDELLETLSDHARANVVVLYDNQGRAIHSTRIPELEAQNLEGDEDDPAYPFSPLNMSEQALSHLRDTSKDPEDLSALEIINQREYQVAYSPLVIRRSRVGYIGAGLSRDYVLSTMADIQGPIQALTVVFMLAIIGLGIYIARQITLPLDELVNTAQSVTAGDLRRRSRVRSRNEIGELSRSFNTMTESLLHLYNRVQAERGQLAAIVESIGDGIVVCNRTGHIQMANRAMRRWLGLSDEEQLPIKFSDLPLHPLPEGEGAFSPDHVSNLQMIGERIVRVSDAPIMAKGQYLGDVYVLQDMTDEVKIDRAKTSFIGTISHELRTPITTLLGTTDLMARGMFGRMEDRQTSEVKIMHGKLAHMTRLINNVIVIADIDAGTLPFDMEPLSAQELVEEATWKMQKEIKEKGLSLSIDIPDDLPPVIADYDHAQTIIRQIVDNARRYTMTGSITIRAARENEFVRFDIIDTGPGIAPDMREQVFERFVRGMGKGQGVDSQERGLGLGLAIVKQLVARQGGHVWVTNATGEGSIFSFTLRHTDVMGTTEKQDEAFGTAA